MASDGIWDVITEEEVEEIIKDFANKKDAVKAANRLMILAKDYWSESSMADDISVIVIYF